MNRVSIPCEKLNLTAIDLWSKGLILTAGINEPGKFNPMTIGWGGIGRMWKKPMIHVVVRPSRYTYQFIEAYDTFSVSVFSEEYERAIGICGTKSGRDIDKLKETGLTPIPSQIIAAPGFAEAELILECRKVYVDEIQPNFFLDANKINALCYPEKDYHRIYFGEILAIQGSAKYLAD